MTAAHPQALGGGTVLPNIDPLVGFISSYPSPVFKALLCGDIFLLWALSAQSTHLTLHSCSPCLASLLFVAQLAFHCPGSGPTAFHGSSVLAHLWCSWSPFLQLPSSGFLFFPQFISGGCTLLCSALLCTWQPHLSWRMVPGLLTPALACLPCQSG